MSTNTLAFVLCCVVVLGSVCWWWGYYVGVGDGRDIESGRAAGEWW
jgi:hypothetical protein